MILRRFNSLFHNAPDPLKTLSQEEHDRINSFEANLETLENSTNDSNRASYFRKLITLFRSAFQNLTPWQGQTERINGLYVRFTDHILNFLQIIFDHQDLYVPLFNCLCTMAHQNNDTVPLAQKFVPFFCQLIKSSKSDQRCLRSSFEFLTVLFKDVDFYKEFLEIDGFTLIFTSFFLPNDKESIDLMLNLLFCVVPPSYYAEPSNTTIAIILDSLKNEEEAKNCCPKCAIFLVNYISMHYQNNQMIFMNFRGEGGFLILNNFLKSKCEPKDAVEVYRILTSKSENNTIVLSSLYELYVDAPTEFRTALLKFLIQIPANDIHHAIPINEWIVNEALMTDEQIELIARIMLNLNYNEYIPFILTFLEKPNTRFEVLDIFFDLLQMLVATHKMPIDVLIERKFVENFFLQPNTQTFIDSLNSHPAISHLMLALYSSPKCEDYRFTIISKLISCFSKNLAEVLKKLFAAHFSLEIFNLLLNNLVNADLVDLLLVEIEERSNSYDLFIECSGFQILEELIETCSESVIKVIGSLAKFGPRSKIDEWINNLPENSKFFQNKELLSKIAVNDKFFLNIPSLLPFVEKFDFTSPLCLFNAGKYGISMFLKRNIPLTEIPSLDKIANRYAPPSIMKFLLSQVEKMDNFVNINVPQFPIYEFIESNLPSKLLFKSQQFISSVKFEFFIPLNSESKNKECYRYTIMSCSHINITCYDNIITFQTEKGGKGSLYAKRGENNIIHVNFTFGEVVAKLNGVSIEHLKTENGFPTEVAFGENPCGQPLYLSRIIHINDQIPRNFESTPNIYCVGYLGFASYYSNMTETEKLFTLLENTNQIQPFSSLYLALLHIQKSRFIDSTLFWKRLLLSLKKADPVIQDSLLLFLHQLPASVYNEKEFTLFLINIFSDYEMYYVINQKSLISLLSLIESYLTDSTSGIIPEIFNEKKMISTFVNIMRSGVSDPIKERLLSFTSVLLSINDNPIVLKEFLSYALTVGDWSLQLPLELDQFPVNSLLPLAIPESSLQCQFLDILIKTIENGKVTGEILSYSQILELSLLFDDYERASYFFKAISIYSMKNPKYIQHSQLSMFAFAKHALERKMWLEAFSILAGKVNTSDIITKHPVIRRPFFVQTILSMLNKLISHEAKYILENSNCDSENEQCIKSEFNVFVNEIMETMTRFDSTDFAYFSGHSTLLILLANFGIVPHSILTSTNNHTTRQEIELNMGDVQLTEQEIKGINDGSEIFKHPEINSSTISVEIDSFPFDAKGLDWIKGLPFDNIILFLTNVMASFDTHNFPTQFSYIAFGSTLMYASYSTFFVTEFISAVLIHYTQSDTMKASPLPVALRAAKYSIFSNNYLHFLSLVVSMMKRRLDPNVLKEFREVILLSFHFIQGQQNRADLDKIFNSYKSIVFHQAVLDDQTFCHLLKYHNVSVTMNPKFLMNYDQSEAEKKWKELQSTITPTYDCDSRTNFTNQIIMNAKSIASTGAKMMLSARIRRVANHYNMTVQQSSLLNIYLRKYERFYFECIKNELLIKLSSSNPTESYHLSNLSLPYSTPRVVSPSPYKIKSPASGSKVPTDFFKLPFKAPQSKIAQVEFFGELQCAPEWCQEQRIYEYSYVLISNRMSDDFQTIFGKATDIVQVYLYYYIHPIPCVLFYQNERMHLLFLATIRDGKIGLISEPHAPIALLPFNEACLLNEWHSTSMFCGHFVLSFEYERFIKVEPHLYVHQRRALSFFYLFDPNFILIFNSLDDYENIEKKTRTLTNGIIKTFNSSTFLFNLPVIEILKLWLDGKISNYDYLIFLNYQSGRGFADCAQYPVFPWVVSPSELEPRNLSLPMGQLNEKRARHYEDTYNESSDPKYFYGCHYSLPGAVFWFLMRMPPFTFFLWDLNEGWDDTQRVFYSINESYISASCTNQTDLKEPIPEIFCVPELYTNDSHLDIEKEKECVALPDWSNNSPFLFTEVSRKFLEKCEDLNKWIDLIFGYKQTGEAALQAKNLFLPSAYHSSTAEFLNIDANAFEDQVINFGQCPKQIFNRQHPSKSKIIRNNIRFITQKLVERQVELFNVTIQGDNFKLGKSASVIPEKSVMIPPNFDYYLAVDDTNEAIYVRKTENHDLMCSIASSDFGFVKDISVSEDGAFIVLSFESGYVKVYFLHHDLKIPRNVELVAKYLGNCECQKSVISSQDFLCASVFGNTVKIWNFATRLLHRELNFDTTTEKPPTDEKIIENNDRKIIDLFFDSFDGCLTILFTHCVEQYSLNSTKLRSYDFNNYDLTCVSMIPYDYTFDGRIIVIGNSLGNIEFLVANEENQLSLIGTKNLFKSRVKDIFVNKNDYKVWCCDDKRHCTELTISIIEQSILIPRCPTCFHEMNQKCTVCGVILCPQCSGTTCINCQHDINLKSSFRLT